MSNTLEDSNGNIVCARSFAYDTKGNLLTEKIYGNLSGNNIVPIIIGKDDYPVQNGVEAYSKTYTYTQDQFNLIQTECDDNAVIRYFYVPNKDLLNAKFICENDQIRIREFYDYDENSVLVRTIKDNGCSADRYDLSGVTEQHITVTFPRKEAPCIGFPAVIEERYLDIISGDEKLLKRLVNSYTREGWLTQQEVYDAQGSYCYTLYWKHDHLGNVIEENDPLGNIIQRQYDANGNLTVEQTPNGTVKYFKYDFSNRLETEKTIEKDGTCYSVNHEYDYLSNLIQTTDRFGQKTAFHYDDFSRQVLTKYPEVANEQGVLSSPIIQRAHNLFGHVVAEIDAEGYQTTLAYNIRGQPVRIDYPDGTFEAKSYHLDGKVKDCTAKNGTVTCYTYDYLKRPIQETVYDREGILLKSTLNCYDAFHLISATDPEGITTTYTYDGAGRLASEVKDDHVLRYTYDTLGRKHKVIENETVKIYIYDFKDHLIEERIENVDGKVFSTTSYLYDVDGNCTHTFQGESVSVTKYNALGQPVEATDAQGNTTTIFYDHTYRNDAGQNVLRKAEIDPCGNVTYSLYDTQGKIASCEKHNPFGQLIAKRDLKYDKNGRLVQALDAVVASGEIDKKILTTWEYNSAGALTHLTEAVNTPEQKHTRYRFNAYGQKEAVIKPDGVEIHYLYDALGRLSHISSTDNTIAYIYTYDRNDHPIAIEDTLNHTITQRVYDIHGNVIKETLAHGLVLESTYDSNGKPTALTLPDKSIVSYTYDAIYLKQVTYKDLTHEYLDYDAKGNILKTKLIGGAGEINFTYDLLNRPTSILAPYFEENEITYDSVGNLLSYRLENSFERFSYDDLYQLKAEEGIASHTYAHDSLNNRLRKDDSSCVHNCLNQLVTQGDIQYLYDANGNLLSIPGEFECTYDAMDRLITLSKQDLKIHFTYDAYHRRLTKRVEEYTYSNWYDYIYGIKSWTVQQEKRFIYQGQCEIGSYEQETLKELRILGNGKGAEIGAAIAFFLNDEWYAPVHDHNGNVTALIHSDTGQLAETYRYSAFGEEFLFNSWRAPVDSSINPWRFSSKRKDPHTHWICFGRRDYDPTLGRWMTPDPQGFEDGPNLYAYVHNNPLTHIDLWGLFSHSGNWVRRGDNWVNKSRSEKSYRNQRYNPFRSFGRALSYGRHLPVPIARKAFSLAGNFFQGFGFKYHEEYTHSHSNFSIVNPNGLPYNLCFNVGQATAEVDGKEQVAEVGALFNATTSNLHYYSTRGFGLDTIHTAILKSGLLDRRIMQWIDHTVTEHIPGKIRLEICWSGGAEVVYQALKYLRTEVKKNLYIVTLGGARMIVDKGLAGQSNIVDVKDPIPFIADPIGVFKGYWNNNVTFVNSGHCFGFGHYFKNPAYQKQLRKIAYYSKELCEGQN